MPHLGFYVAAICTAVALTLIIRFIHRKNDSDHIVVPETPEPPDPTYNDVVVFEAEEIGHGVYELEFWGYVDDEVANNFPESLAYFIQQHPSLRIINICAGRESCDGVTESMIILTEPRSTT